MCKCSFLVWHKDLREGEWVLNRVLPECDPNDCASTEELSDG